MNLGQYLDLITDAKKKVKIPVIGSVNCTSSHEWTYFAEKIESAGADALEINIMILPSDTTLIAEQVERTYIEIIRAVRDKVKIPLSVKIPYYFTNLAGFIKQLSHCNIEGIVLFNRFYNPDFDIEKMHLTSTNVFSSPSDLPVSLRWIAVMSDKVSCDLAASTGVHDGKAVVKQLLAGATAVQVVSALYQHGPAHLQAMLSELKGWMSGKGHGTLDDFRGMLSQGKLSSPGFFERVQFMKYFSDRDKIPQK